MKPILFALAVTVPFLAGCEGMKARQQDRCQTADWVDVGERDGREIGRESIHMQGERYQRICGDMFKLDAYTKGVQAGMAKRPTPQGR